MNGLRGLRLPRASLVAVLEIENWRAELFAGIGSPMRSCGEVCRRIRYLLSEIFGIAADNERHVEGWQGSQVGVNLTSRYR
jgi:hypothetical protein